MFKKGSKVRQVVPVIEGEVTATRFNEEQQQLEYHVGFGTEEDPSARWFLESELEAVEADDSDAPATDTDTVKV